MCGNPRACPAAWEGRWCDETAAGAARIGHRHIALVLRGTAEENELHGGWSCTVRRRCMRLGVKPGLGWRITPCFFVCRCGGLCALLQSELCLALRYRYLGLLREF